MTVHIRCKHLCVHLVYVYFNIHSSLLLLKIPVERFKFTRITMNLVLTSSFWYNNCIQYTA